MGGAKAEVTVEAAKGVEAREEAVWVEVEKVVEDLEVEEGEEVAMAAEE